MCFMDVECRSLVTPDSVLSVDPCLTYCAPEMTSSSPSCSFASDVFSLGLLFLQVIRPDATPLIKVLNNGDAAGHQRQVRVPFDKNSTR